MRRRWSREVDPIGDAARQLGISRLSLLLKTREKLARELSDPNNFAAQQNLDAMIRAAFNHQAIEYDSTRHTPAQAQALFERIGRE